jgi:multiple sugar transport system ATP-binding protein
MAVVELEGLTKVYAGAHEPAVAEVDLRIEDGEFMVLLGPSGCGKSTTLRMIAGLEAISAGRLAIDGAPMNQVPAKDRDIAMVFQSYALYPHMKVRDNLAFGLRRRGFPRAEIDARVERVAASLGLSTLLERRPHALSGGQRQRVALGRAIVRDPKVFLFDEPLSNLDAALRVSTRGELIKLHQRLGATMIYVTHDQVEAMTMGSRICIMNQGRVVQIGAPMEVYRRPVDSFVASFLGSPPMNLLPTSVVSGGPADGPILRLGAQTMAAPTAWHRALAAGHGEVVLGIRPEDILLPGSAGGGAQAPLDARVVAIEHLGAETLLLLELDGLAMDVTARVGREAPVRHGERLAVAFDLAAAHLFDRATGRVLTAQRGVA